MSAPSTFGRSLLWPVPSVVYAVVTVALTTTGFLLDSTATGAVWWPVFWVGLLLTGPLGFVAAIFLAFPLANTVVQTPTDYVGRTFPSVFDPSVLPNAILVLGTTAVLVTANVLILRRWVHTTRAAIDRGDSRPVQRAVDRLVGAGLFVYSGAGFVVLCFAAGYGAFAEEALVVTLSGSDDGSGMAINVIAIAFFSALAAALAGLVLWIVFSVKRLPILIPAAIDFAIVAAALVTVFVTVLS